MCDGMWTRWGRPGWRWRSRSAARTAFSGCGDASTAWMYRWQASGWSGLDRQHRLEHVQHLLRARLRLAAGRPEVPRPQVHQGLGVERPDVRIPGMVPPDRLHRRGVRLVERLAILRLGPAYRFEAASIRARSTAPAAS